MTARGWTPADAWSAAADEVESLASCVRAAEAVLMTGGITQRLRKQLLDQIIWHATEYPHKYALRYRSSGAIAETRRPFPKHLRHEHVVPRKWIIEALFRHPDRAGDILRGAVACTVTKDEAALLNRVPASIQGWERYERAGITVHDMGDGGRVVAAAELAMRHPVPEL